MNFIEAFFMIILIIGLIVFITILWFWITKWWLKRRYNEDEDESKRGEGYRKGVLSSRENKIKENRKRYDTDRESDSTTSGSDITQGRRSLPSATTNSLGKNSQKSRVPSRSEIYENVARR